MPRAWAYWGGVTQFPFEDAILRGLLSHACSYHQCNCSKQETLTQSGHCIVFLHSVVILTVNPWISEQIAIKVCMIY